MFIWPFQRSLRVVPDSSKYYTQQNAIADFHLIRTVPFHLQSLLQLHINRKDLNYWRRKLVAGIRKLRKKHAGNYRGTTGLDYTVCFSFYKVNHFYRRSLMKTKYTFQRLLPCSVKKHRYLTQF